MKLYLGNDAAVEIDVSDDDELLLAPTKAGTCSIKHESSHKRHVALCWVGLEKKNMYFPHSCFQSVSDAYKAAKYYLVAMQPNTVNTLLTCKVKDLTDEIITNFRYIQPTVEYLYQDVPLDSYMLGIFLGDGTTKNGDITNIDFEVIQYCQRYGKRYGMKFVPRKDQGITYFFESETTNVFRETLKSLGVIGNKHIPKIYMHNSLEVRLALLAGLIDTDGSLLGNYYEITQKRVELANDIIELAKGCGFFVRTVDKWSCATNTEKKTKRLYKRTFIYLGRNSNIIPVQIPRKMFDPMTDIQYEHGIVIKFEKSTKSFRNEWTDEMKKMFVETRDKYISSHGKYQWRQMVENEELYKHMSHDALRTYNRNIK